MNPDDSFLPSTLNREMLHELAANFKLMELTPDYNEQILHNKSIFQTREDSGMYACDPIEMTMSPRTLDNISAIQNQMVTTTQTYFKKEQE